MRPLLNTRSDRFDYLEPVVALIICFLSMDIAAGHLDLQYIPLVDLEAYFVIAPCVLAASNLVRSVSFAKRSQNFILGPDVTAVVGTLFALGFKIKRDEELGVGGKRAEFECQRD